MSNIKTDKNPQSIKSWMYLPIFLLIIILIPIVIVLIIIALPFATICFVAYQLSEIFMQKGETEIQKHRDALKLEAKLKQDANYLQYLYKVETFKSR